MDVSDAQRLKSLEAERARLKKLLAASMLENDMTREALRKVGDRSSASDGVDGNERADGASWTVDRCGARDSLRYQPRADRKTALRERIVSLAQRHRRYGVGVVHLKLRQAGERSPTSGPSVFIRPSSASSTGL
jgi:hypothetical protein